jgi:hypothetical protein
VNKCQKATKRGYEETPRCNEQNQRGTNGCLAIKALNRCQKALNRCQKAVNRCQKAMNGCLQAKTKCPEVHQSQDEPQGGTGSGSPLRLFFNITSLQAEPLSRKRFVDGRTGCLKSALGLCWGNLASAWPYMVSGCSFNSNLG